MRVSLLACFAIGTGCAAARTDRVCTPITSWAAPAYRCTGTEVVAAAPEPAPEPAPAEPAKPRVAVDGDQINLGDKIQFETDSAVLLPESEKLLDEVAATIKDHPEFAKIEIDGHTDARASDSYNQKLSTQRAEAVRAYLIKQGIEGDRLTARGFGESKPIADNKSDDGMFQNRRVELKIVARKPVASN